MADLSLATEIFDFDALEKKYRNFFAPALRLRVGGADFLKQGIAVDSVVYESNVEESDSFRFRVTNSYDIIKNDFKKDWVGSCLCKDSVVEIGMGYVDKLPTMMSGVVSHLDFSFSDKDAPAVTVRGMDRSFYLMRGNEIKSWSNLTHSQIVSRIITEYGLIAGEIEDTGKVVAEETKNRTESDFLLIKRLAEKNGYEFFIIGNKVYFKQANDSADAQPNLTLAPGRGLISFDASVNIDNTMVTKAIITRDDDQGNLHLRGEIGDIDKYTGGSLSGARILAQKCKKRPVYTEERNDVKDNEEAKTAAKAILNMRCENLVTGSATTVGLPEIRAGLYIKIEGVGERLSRLYYVTKATHTFDSNGYWTNFTFRGNAI